MRFKKITSVLLAAVVFACPFGAGVYAEKQTSQEYQAFEQIAGYIVDGYIDGTLTLEEVMEQGLSNYLSGNDERLIGLLKSTFESLDPYSKFYTAEEYRQFTDSVNQVFYGIGVALQKSGQYVSVTGFTDESRAEEAGMQVGDQIVKVDGVNVVGWEADSVRALIMGELGTTVHIVVLREEQEIALNIARIELNQTTVSGGILEGNIGYIKISSMAVSTPSDFKKMLEELEQANVKKVILDLRNNGGGLTSSAVEIAKMLVPAGVIIQTIYRQEAYNQTYYSELEKAPYELEVLVNGNTASASEILASAIQESKAGILLGETTYGKALIQTIHPLANGMVFKMTTGQYVTRNGNKINGSGLRPDVFVANYTKPIDVSKYSSFDYKTKWELGMSGEGVKAAKQRLSALGYYMGSIDENYNDAIRIPVEKFQEDTGLYPYGVLDVTTQVKIENEFAKLEVVVDRQLQTAYEKFGGNADNLYD
jgi:carboxyl-terminal processing protease